MTRISNFIGVELDNYENIILLDLIMIYRTTNAGDLRFVRNVSRTRRSRERPQNSF